MTAKHCILDYTLVAPHSAHGTLQSTENGSICTHVVLRVTRSRKFSFSQSSPVLLEGFQEQSIRSEQFILGEGVSQNRGHFICVVVKKKRQRNTQGIKRELKIPFLKKGNLINKTEPTIFFPISFLFVFYSS